MYFTLFVYMALHFLFCTFNLCLSVYLTIKCSMPLCFKNRQSNDSYARGWLYCPIFTFPSKFTHDKMSSIENGTAYQRLEQVKYLFVLGIPCACSSFNNLDFKNILYANSIVLPEY